MKEVDFARVDAVPALTGKRCTRFTREPTAPRALRRPDDHAALKLVPIEIVLTEHAQELAAEECDVVLAVLDDAWRGKVAAALTRSADSVL